MATLFIIIRHAVIHCEALANTLEGYIVARCSQADIALYSN